MLLLLPLMGFIEELHVFFQLSSIGLFGTKRAYLHLEKPKLQEIFLSETNSLLTGNNVLEAAAYNKTVLF
jgi:hypothetical protein